MSKTRLVFAIDTTAYSGNFERELVGFVTGLYTEEQYHGETEAEEFRDWATEKGLDPHMFEPVVEETNDEEYGWRYPIMLATPGRLNNGTGQHYDAAPGEKGWPAYESVGFAISRTFTDDELKIIKDRAQEFAKHQGFEIRGFRLIIETTQSNIEDMNL